MESHAVALARWESGGERAPALDAAAFAAARARTRHRGAASSVANSVAVRRGPMLASNGPAGGTTGGCVTRDSSPRANETSSASSRGSAAGPGSESPPGAGPSGRLSGGRCGSYPAPPPNVSSWPSPWLSPCMSVYPLAMLARGHAEYPQPPAWFGSVSSSRIRAGASPGCSIRSFRSLRSSSSPSAPFLCDLCVLCG